MRIEQLFTKLREGSKQQQYLLSAKLGALASFCFALVSLGKLTDRHWLFGIMFASLAVLYGCLAFAQYMLSRKASGE